MRPVERRAAVTEEAGERVVEDSTRWVDSWTSSRQRVANNRR